MDWQAIGVILGGIGLIGTGLGFLFKNLIDRRFEALETIIQNQEKTTQAMQLAFQKFQLETPGIYARREECTKCKEDWTYVQSVLDAKMDIILRRMKKQRSRDDGKKPE